MGNICLPPGSDRPLDGASAPNASNTSAPSAAPGGPIARGPLRTAAAPRANPLQLSTITDVSQLTPLVEYNDRLLARIKGAGVSGPITSRSDVSNFVAELIGFASNLMERSATKAGQLRRTENLPCLESVRLFRNSMRGLGQLHRAGIGFAVIAYVLERFDTVSSHRGDCIKLLDSMTALAKRLLNLYERIPGEGEGMNRAVEKIVEGSIVCCCHMRRGKFARYWSAKTKTMKERLEDTRQNVQLMYSEVDNMIIMDIQGHQPHPVPQPQQECQEFEPVGVEDQAAQVAQLLDMDGSERALAVIIYGFGGVGKSTIAHYVVGKLNLTSFKHSTVRVDNNSSHIKRLQEIIIFELGGRRIDLKDDMQGRIEVGKVLREQSCFLLIDNVTKREHISKLLPKKLSNGNQKLRILITSRSNNVKEELDIAHREYLVNTLSDKSAKELLRKTIFRSDGSDTMEDHKIDSLVSACGGIPLLLEVYGKYLRENGSEAAYRGVLDSLLKGEHGKFGSEEDLSFRLLHVYHEMDDKEAFLDICTILHGLQVDLVSSTVRNMQLKTLQRGALVKNFSNEVIVHVVLRNIGIKKAEGTRLQNLDELKAIIGDQEKLERVKGLWLANNQCLFTLNVADLNKMSDSLRILALGNWIKIDQKSDRIFSHLRFLQVGDLALFPFRERYQFPELRVFHSNTRVSEDLAKTLPTTLEQIRLVAPPDDTAAVLPQGFWDSIMNMENLQKFEFIHFEEVELIPKKFMFSSSLVELDMTGCSKLQKLPEGMGRLTKLMTLTLNGCKSLGALPEDFCKMSSLKWLKMNRCRSLTALPANIGELSSLQELDLTKCIKLNRLPESFRALTSLAQVSLTGLVELPDKIIGNLSSLTQLELLSCNSLKSLPENIGSLSSLRNLALHSCSSLKSLPESIGNLSSLRNLTLQSCSSLKCLPESIGNLSSLSTLTLRSCRSLTSLPKCIGNLHGLTELTLESCTSLARLPSGIDNLKSNLVVKTSGNRFTGPEDWQPAASMAFFSGQPRLVDSNGTSFEKIRSHTTEDEQTSESEWAKSGLQQSSSSGQEISDFTQFVEEMASQHIHNFITHNGEKISLANMEGTWDCLFIVHCNPVVLELFKMNHMYGDLKRTCSKTLFAWIPQFHPELYGRELYGVGSYERARHTNQWLMTVPDPTLCRSCDPDGVAIYDGQGRMIEIRDTETSDAVLMWGAEAYPFTNQRIEELKKKESTDMRQCQSSLEFLLGDLEFVDCHEKLVKKESLLGKIILLYVTSMAEFEFKWRLIELREMLINNGVDNCEIVHVCNINVGEEFTMLKNRQADHPLFSMIEEYKDETEEMPWPRLSLPNSVKFHLRIKWLCSESNMYLVNDPKWAKIKTLATCVNGKDANECVVLIDPNGEVLTSQGEEIMDVLMSENDGNAETRDKVIECMRSGKCDDMKKLLRVRGLRQ